MVILHSSWEPVPCRVSYSGGERRFIYRAEFRRRNSEDARARVTRQKERCVHCWSERRNERGLGAGLACSNIFRSSHYLRAWNRLLQWRNQGRGAAPYLVKKSSLKKEAQTGAHYPGNGLLAQKGGKNFSISPSSRQTLDPL